MTSKISKRLKAVADVAGGADCVLDMGTDHGYVPLYLIENHYAQKVIASDISAPSLKKAKKKIEKAHLENYIETRLGSGLDVIDEGESDTIIMAGMGGLLISDILKKSWEKAASSRLVLQPMNHVVDVRLSLEALHFCIIDERIIFEEDHFYQIITAVPGMMRIQEPVDYWIGYEPARHQNAIFFAFVKELLRTEKNVMNSLQKKDTVNAKRRLQQGIGFKALLKEVLS